MNFTQPLPLSDRISLTLDGLARAVAARSARGFVGWVLETALILVIWRRVKRTEVRIQSLLVRFQAGRLRAFPGRVSPERVSRPMREGVGARGRSAAAGVPRRFGWVLPLVPHEAANFASQLRVLLAEPEMAALLAASRQAMRVMAPLCRMLGIETAMLAPKEAAHAGDAVAVGVVDAPPLAEVVPVAIAGEDRRRDWSAVRLE